MALRLLEGFEMYGDSARTGPTLETDIVRRHEGTRTIYGTDGELITGRGGSGLALNYPDADSNNKIMLTRFDPTQSETWIIGFAIRTGDLCDNLSRLFDSYDYVVSLYLLEGRLTVRAHDWTAEEFCNCTLKSNRWYYIEIKIFHNNTTGTIEVHVDGESVYSTSSRQVWDSDHSRGAFSLHATDNNTAFDDIYVCDGSGSDNNDFLGPIKIETLRPTDDDGSQNWTPSSGSNHYDLVDSSNLWQITDYVEANGANVDDLWTYSNISKITGNIYGAQAVVSGWTETAMAQPIQLICESGNTIEYSSTRGLGVEANYPMPHEKIWENDPDTANVWTSNGINAASFGIRKI